MRPDIWSAITNAETKRLAELATGRRVLEVGSQFGYSTVVMALVATAVHAVDWHQGDDIVGDHDSLPKLWVNLGRYDVRERVVVHVGRSETVLPLLPAGSFDFAFHDADHTTEAVLTDARLILPLLAPGALLAFHDFGRYGVREAVEALGLEQVSLTHSLVVVQT
jgi:predicted O-methyltransferase YrrM